MSINFLIVKELEKKCPNTKEIVEPPQGGLALDKIIKDVDIRPDMIYNFITQEEILSKPYR